MAKEQQPVHPLFGGKLEGNKKPSGAAKTSGPKAKADPKAKSKTKSKVKSRRKASSDSTRARSLSSDKPRTRRKPGGGGKKTAQHSGPPAGTVRIQKLLAEIGLDSRRACEQIVADGRVSVNGKLVTKLPCFVHPDSDEVAIDGEKVRVRTEKKVYLLLNKPRGVVCTSSDAEDRPRAVDLVAHVSQRVYPVGRLDADSTGVIIMTNDGDFANLISHPRYGVAKTYVVEVDGHVDGAAIEKLKAGMHLDGHRTRSAGVKVLQRSKVRTLLEIRLNEGRNREIRRMLARLDYKVRALRRVAIGPISDHGIKTGNCRMLRPDEIEKLIDAAKM